MSERQVEKVRQVLETVKGMPEKHEMTGWVRGDYIFMFIKVGHFGWGAKNVRLFAIDRKGALMGYDGSDMKWVNGDKGFHTTVDWLTEVEKPLSSKYVRALTTQLGE